MQARDWRIGSNLLYRPIDGDVYRMSTGRGIRMRHMRGFRSNSGPRAHYHQQYLAKNPNGYCGIGGCGVPFKLAEIQMGEKA